jgi:hypothetical protein
MKAIQTERGIVIGIPNYWLHTNSEGGFESFELYQSRTDLHYQHGWRNLVYPEVGEFQKYGDVIFNAESDVFEYEVLDFTEIEIQNKIQENFEAQKKIDFDLYKKNQLQNKINELSDTEALEIASLYPFWSSNGEQVVVGNKRNHFSSDGTEVWLWRCKLDHITQADWQPKDSPSLWERVEQDGEVLPYDPYRIYQIGELCAFEDKVYKCIMANTTWSPSGYPAAWEYQNDL